MRHNRIKTTTGAALLAAVSVTTGCGTFNVSVPPGPSSTPPLSAAPPQSSTPKARATAPKAAPDSKVRPRRKTPPAPKKTKAQPPTAEQLLRAAVKALQDAGSYRMQITQGGGTMDFVVTRQRLVIGMVGTVGSGFEFVATGDGIYVCGPVDVWTSLSFSDAEAALLADHWIYIDSTSQYYDRVRDFDVFADARVQFEENVASLTVSGTQTRVTVDGTPAIELALAGGGTIDVAASAPHYPLVIGAVRLDGFTDEVGVDTPQAQDIQMVLP